MPRDPVAAFITPHGFGHAARAVAALEALHRRRPGLEAHLFTRRPRWFFEESLGAPFELHDCLADVGLVQRSAIDEDLPATVEALDGFLPFDEARLAPLADRLHELDCRLVLCDVSPLGIAAAERAGLPSVLVESFTWDWIYRAYVADEPRLERFIEPLRALYDLATLRLQAAPCCRPLPGAVAVGPVARAFRSPPAEVRRRLEVEAATPLVVVTMGGIPWEFDRTEPLAGYPDAVFVLLGAAPEPAFRGNLRLLPHHSPIHHPDLVATADVLVGKPGYSTLAEALQAGTALLFVDRPRFPESRVLTAYAARHLPVATVPPAAFDDGGWLAELPALLAAERPAPRTLTGAAEIAEHLERLLTPTANL